MLRCLSCDVYVVAPGTDELFANVSVRTLPRPTCFLSLSIIPSFVQQVFTECQRGPERVVVMTHPRGLHDAVSGAKTRNSVK